MSNAKHTPGPWKARNGRIFQEDREELTIANIARAFDGDYSPANASLIAAAPELLSLLERVTAKLEWLNSDDCAHIMALTDEARAVIAKAKGDLVGMWNAIPEGERKELTKAFAQGFNEQAKGE